MDMVEAYDMMNGMCEDKRVKLIRDECQATRDLPLANKRGMKYIELQKNHCMNNRGKTSFCIIKSNTVISNMAQVSTVVANLIYEKIENNDVFRILTIKQELCKSQKREQQIKVDVEQVKNLV